MNEVTWVVQANYLNQERQNNVARTLTHLNIPFVGVNVKHFEDAMHFLFDEPQHKRVIPYGSIGLVRRGIAKGWQGCFVNANTFRVDVWQQERSDMVNKSHIFTVDEALTWCQLQTDGEFHIRPVEDNKLFPGMVMKLHEIVAWLSKTEETARQGGQLLPSTQIAISPAQVLQAEWRWFVVDGKVIDGSLYRMRGQPLREHETDAAVIAEAQGLADKWLPHPTCVMDVALVNNTPSILEFNNLNGSGFYAHDVAKILQAVTDSVKRL